MSNHYWVSKSYGKRNKEILELAKTGKYTYQMLGDKYGVTKERVRQIVWRGIAIENRKYGIDFAINMAHTEFRRKRKEYRDEQKSIKNQLFKFLKSLERR